eukprot:TRINITY_DN44132_c0_g2_i2.p1 TRINITY_DN44132_c0_g2~~TRINITY_DN44132_c0_g2_i2.p1  ORF type:complete len:790 (+),score=122.11 TRINITY_DN44132_c0_g2_i2:159-2528(+)
MHAAESAKGDQFSLLKSEINASDHSAAWVFRQYGRPRTLFALLVPVAMCFVSSCALGAWMNASFFGTWSGGGASEAGTHVNALRIAVLTAATASALAIIRFGVKCYLHPRIYGCFSFVAYCALMGLLVQDSYSGNYTSNTRPATEFSSQLLEVLGERFNFEDERFATRFKDISHAGEFYNWLKGPFKDLLTGGPQNSQSQANRSNTYIPSLIYDDAGSARESPGAAVWVVPACRLRVVRSSSEPMRPIRYSRRQANKILSLSYTNRISRFSKEMQNRTARGSFSRKDHTGTYTESFVDNKFTNSWGKRLGAWIYQGPASYVRYPGHSGQVLTSPLQIEGMWYPMSSDQSPDDYAALVDEEVEAMESNRFIDQTTAMAQVSCTVLNPSNNMVACLFYTLEFFNTGKVHPDGPHITVGRFQEEPLDEVSLLMLFGFYFFLEEFQDLILDGFKVYVLEAGWANLLDWTVIICAVAAEILHCVYIGLTPSAATEHYWSLASAQTYFRIALGFTMFTSILRSLKYTNNVPVMCHIGLAFGNAAFTICLFLLTMFVLFLAFGSCFHIVFSTELQAFGTFQNSMFSMFQGLLGNMDGEAIKSAQPTIGPILFVLYYIMVLFVGFTILIAIITDSYESVKDRQPRSGVVVCMRRWAAAWFGSGASDATDNHSDAEDFISLHDEEEKWVHSTLARLSEQVVRLESRLTDKLELEDPEHKEAATDSTLGTGSEDPTESDAVHLQINASAQPMRFSFTSAQLPWAAVQDWDQVSTKSSPASDVPLLRISTGIPLVRARSI